MHVRNLLVAGLVATFASAAPAVPHFEVVDVGVPTNGSVVMTGYRGYVVRAVSDVGPILSVDFSSDPVTGVQNRIEGGLAQRWTDPTGGGNYTVHSPGLDAARNASPSELNFDSHYLVNPSEVVADRLFEDAIPGFGFIQAGDAQYPNYTPLVSTPFVGYGTALGGRRFGEPLPGIGYLEGRFAVLPEFRRDVIDVAYVVSNTRVTGIGGIYVSDLYQNATSFFEVDVPEPTVLLAGAVAAVAFVGRRRTGTRTPNDSRPAFGAALPSLDSDDAVPASSARTV